MDMTTAHRMERPRRLNTHCNRNGLIDACLEGC
jgi:hypothetical protein